MEQAKNFLDHRWLTNLLLSLLTAVLSIGVPAMINRWDQVTRKLDDIAQGFALLSQEVKYSKLDITNLQVRMGALEVEMQTLKLEIARHGTQKNTWRTADKPYTPLVAEGTPYWLDTNSTGYGIKGIRNRYSGAGAASLAAQWRELRAFDRISYERSGAKRQ